LAGVGNAEIDIFEKLAPSFDVVGIGFAGDGVLRGSGLFSRRRSLIGHGVFSPLGELG
jgi:hypothetical protein